MFQEKQARTNLHKMLSGHWPHDEYKDITWLNESQGNWDVALVNLTYGNEASFDWSYSHAVLIVEIEAHNDRTNDDHSGETSTL